MPMLNLHEWKIIENEFEAKYDSATDLLKNISMKVSPVTTDKNRRISSLLFTKNIQNNVSNKITIHIFAHRIDEQLVQKHLKSLNKNRQGEYSKIEFMTDKMTFKATINITMGELKDLLKFITSLEEKQFQMSEESIKQITQQLTAEAINKRFPNQQEECQAIPKNIWTVSTPVVNPNKTSLAVTFKPNVKEHKNVYQIDAQRDIKSGDVLVKIYVTENQDKIYKLLKAAYPNTEKQSESLNLFPKSIVHLKVPYADLAAVLKQVTHLEEKREERMHSTSITNCVQALSDSALANYIKKPNVAHTRPMQTR